MGHPSIETRENPLYVKGMLLSLYVMSICDAMETCEQALVSQMKRSARSVKNCINEAQSPESRADFIHKLKMADKELHELVGMIATEAHVHELLKSRQVLLLDLSADLAKLLGRTIATARKNQKKI